MEDVREASTVNESFLDCARFAEADDLLWMKQVMQEDPTLLNCSDDLGRTPCHMAAANGNTEALRVLVAAGAEASRNSEGNTALHYAAVNDHVSCAQLLLESGRWKVSTRNHLGKTALQEIGEKEFDEMEMLLLKFDDELDNYKCPAAASLDLGDDVETDAAAPAAHLAKPAEEHSCGLPLRAETDDSGKVSTLTGSAAVDDVE